MNVYELTKEEISLYKETNHIKGRIKIMWHDIVSKLSPELRNEAHEKGFSIIKHPLFQYISHPTFSRTDTLVVSKASQALQKELETLDIQIIVLL